MYIYESIEARMYVRQPPEVSGAAPPCGISLSREIHVELLFVDDDVKKCFTLTSCVVALGVEGVGTERLWFWGNCECR